VFVRKGPGNPFFGIQIRKNSRKNFWALAEKNLESSVWTEKVSFDFTPN
jgi:hypothetical protein